VAFERISRSISSWLTFTKSRHFLAFLGRKAVAAAACIALRLAHQIAYSLSRRLEFIGQFFGRSTGENERDELRREFRRICVAVALRHSEIPRPHRASVHGTGSTSAITTRLIEPSVGSLRFG